MKKGNVLILAIAATALLGGSAWLYAKKTGGHEEKKTSLRIGVLLYRGDDTFIGTLRNSMEQAAKEYEKETGVRVTLDVRDAKRNQLTQNSQAERMIDLGCDVLCVNMVDRSAASGVIDQAMEVGYSHCLFQPGAGRGGHEPLGETVLCGSGRKGVRGSGGADPRRRLPEESVHP